eukprot:gene370-6784_t
MKRKHEKEGEGEIFKNELDHLLERETALKLELYLLKSKSIPTIEEEKMDELEDLIEKWISSSQLGLNELLLRIKYTKPEITMEKLLTHFRIDSKIVRYDEEEEEFY